LADRAIFLTLGPIGEGQRRSETALWREFELARPGIVGALLDAAAQGLRAAGSVPRARLPRMADFALWAQACEPALWPAGTFARAYTANRRASIEEIIDPDPVAAWVRDLMVERSSWAGSASELLRIGLNRSSDRNSRGTAGWPENPRALSGHLRRAQTFLRMLGTQIAFRREGRDGARIIRIHRSLEHTANPVGSARQAITNPIRLYQGHQPAAA
jgi:hypothetical protein